MCIFKCLSPNVAHWTPYKVEEAVIGCWWWINARSIAFQICLYLFSGIILCIDEQQLPELLRAASAADLTDGSRAIFFVDVHRPLSMSVNLVAPSPVIDPYANISSELSDAQAALLVLKFHPLSLTALNASDIIPENIFEASFRYF